MNQKTKFTLDGYVRVARADGLVTVIDCGSAGLVEIKSKESLFDLYCHDVCITIDDLGNPDEDRTEEEIAEDRAADEAWEDRVAEANAETARAKRIAEFEAKADHVGRRLHSSKNKTRDDFRNLLTQSPNDAADVFISIRKRIKKYQDLKEFESGTVAAQLATELGLTDLQEGRLQMIVRQAGERTREAVRQFDPKSPALHPEDQE